MKASLPLSLRNVYAPGEPLTEPGRKKPFLGENALEFALVLLRIPVEIIITAIFLIACTLLIHFLESIFR